MGGLFSCELCGIFALLAFQLSEATIEPIITGTEIGGTLPLSRVRAPELFHSFAQPVDLGSLRVDLGGQGVDVIAQIRVWRVIVLHLVQSLPGLGL